MTCVVEGLQQTIKKFQALALTYAQFFYSPRIKSVLPRHPAKPVTETLRASRVLGWLVGNLVTTALRLDPREPFIGILFTFDHQPVESRNFFLCLVLVVTRWKSFARMNFLNSSKFSILTCVKIVRLKIWR